MAKKNDTLRNANKAKNDEFYTQYEDIQREINAYLEYNPNVFRDKIVLLPCDDPEWSNFTRFFAQNFENLGLKKLISTSYSANSKKNKYGQNIGYEQLSLFDITDFEFNSPNYNDKKTHENGKIFVLERDVDNSHTIDINDLQWKYLDGDGDFRSDEVKKLRDESDIIVTNPPFSLFREFVAWILEGNKNFLIIGNQNAITYREIFPLLRDNKMWIGKRFNERINGLNMTFAVPDSYPLTGTENFISADGKKYISVAGTGWFTNIEHGRRHQPLSLMTMDDNIKYSKHAEVRNVGYRKYYNYDAIDVPYTDAIPSDYEGDMGVPVTFLKYHCPEQFEIIGLGISNSGIEIGVKGYTEEHKNYRKLVQKKGAVDGDLYMLDENGHPEVPYARIIIRKKENYGN